MNINKKYKDLLNRTEAVLFDLDGSLMDSMWIWKSIDIAYLKKYDIECPVDLQKRIEGLSVVETAYYFQERFKIDDTVDNMISDWNDMAYDKYVNEVPLKDGAYEFLEFCNKNNIKLAICSSNSDVLLDAVLKKHNIKDMFKIIVSGHDVEKGKPDPECYLKAADFMGVNPKNCIVFEDIPMGINAGKSAGMTVFAVEDEYSLKYTEEKENLSDYYIKDYFDLFE